MINMNLIKEAIFVGIIIVLIGTIIGYIMRIYFSQNLPDICKEWNKNHIMEICLFLTGFFTHIVCELIGINKWYCKNSVACNI